MVIKMMVKAVQTKVAIKMVIKMTQANLVTKKRVMTLGIQTKEDHPILVQQVEYGMLLILTVANL